MPFGRKNSYRCLKCMAVKVTIDRHEGVTPFLIRCGTGGCREMMQSDFYQVDQSLPATHEWYSPGILERSVLTRGEQEHVEKGGLLLRKIES